MHRQLQRSAQFKASRNQHRQSYAAQDHKSKRSLLVKLALWSGVATLLLWSITAAALISMPSDFIFLHLWSVIICGPGGLLAAFITLGLLVLAIEDKI